MKEIFWINGGAAPHIAIVLRPQGGDWLEPSVHRLKDAGVHTLVSLMEPYEAKYYGLEEEELVAADLGIEFLSYPIRDGDVPSDETGFRQFVEALAARLKKGEHIGVHCLGSIGRSTIMVCCALMHLGWDAQSALMAARLTRGTIVPETEEQESWILNYEAQA